MKEVVSSSAVFFSYALLAIFAQNAVFTRALGVSRMVQLVGDDRTSSALFGMMLCITQVLVAPVAFVAHHAGVYRRAGAGDLWLYRTFRHPVMQTGRKRYHG